MNSTRKEVNDDVSVECIFCTEPYIDPPMDDWIMCATGGVMKPVQTLINIMQQVLLCVVNADKLTIDIG